MKCVPVLCLEKSTFYIFDCLPAGMPQVTEFMHTYDTLARSYGLEANDPLGIALVAAISLYHLAPEKNYRCAMGLTMAMLYFNRNGIDEDDEQICLDHLGMPAHQVRQCITHNSGLDFLEAIVDVVKKYRPSMTGAFIHALNDYRASLLLLESRLGVTGLAREYMASKN